MAAPRWSRRELRPDGVNLGGWFCLEDWFYSCSSGPNKGHCVKTPEPTPNVEGAPGVNVDAYVAEVGKLLELTAKEASQLPRSRFGCESDLINLLLRAGLTEARVVELFWRHRRTYVTPRDFARIRAMGVRRVRLPLTWCLTYDTPYEVRGRDFRGRDTSVMVQPGAHIVEDPFTNEPAFDPEGMASPADRWVSIPIQVVEGILEAAADFGLEVLLDIHAFPGGAAAGTFNGVWPVNPRFWSAHREENFRTINGRLLDWMAGLSTKNPKAFRALYGLTPMNEPAHLRGLYDPKGVGISSTYNLRGAQIWAAGVSAADVLATLGTAVEEYRRRGALVGAGKKLVMNVIETAFLECFGAEDAQAFGASQKGESATVLGRIGSWWREVTTPEERQRWAILDIHNYIAWNPKVGQFREMRSFDEFRELIEELSLPFFRTLRDRVGIPAPELLATSEYSASTDQDTLTSVTSGVGPRPPNFPGFSWQAVRDWFLVAQHRAAGDAGISMWFWTYHIRRNVNFQGEWSLQHVLSPWPRLWNLLLGPPRLSDIGGVATEALCCIHHFASVSWFLFLASACSPWRSLWLQALGGRFGFFPSAPRS